MIFKNIWLNSYYEEINCGSVESYEIVDREIGNDGIYLPCVFPSPVQHLIELEMGPECFYYMLDDYKNEMSEFLNIMHNCRLQEYRIIAEKMPYSACFAMENTSTTLISPKLYRDLSLPQIRDFVDIMHSNGKKAIVHMCGLLRNLLVDFKETGIDGIHALTPPTIGDTEYELALDVLGEDLIIIGCLDSTIFQKQNVTKEEFLMIKEWVDKFGRK